MGANMISRRLKQTIAGIADMCGVARLFRYINRKRLLVVMYHGITTTCYAPPIWTQLPLETFRQHMEFLRIHYVPVSLSEVVKAIRGESTLPERAVLITFDDGLRNNYSVAFPVLQELHLPAAIFLTVDLIGSEEILWFDELYFLLQAAAELGISPDLPDASARTLLQGGRVWESYLITAETLKRAGTSARHRYMAALRADVPLDRRRLLGDFGLLHWDEVRSMFRSGLAEFGIHTATHRILTELADDEWEHEIIVPKHTLEHELNTETTAFCFPNGRPRTDFSLDQLGPLRKAGYSCAFTTENNLFDWTGGDSMTIGRVPAGNDATSDTSFFPLNTSGFLHFVRGMFKMAHFSSRATGAEI